MNFFKKLITQTINKKENVSEISTIDVNTIVAEIHENFDTASDRLLKEAQEIINTGFKPVEINTYAKLANSLGFINTKDVREMRIAIEKNNSEIERLKKIKQLADDLIHFKERYPSHKIINKEEIEKICKKYNLVFGNCTLYKGEIPKKNLEEIANFNKGMFIPEDLCYYRTRVDSWGGNTKKVKELVSYDFYKYFMSSITTISKDLHTLTLMHRSDENVTIDNVFYICAPVKDMDMTNMKIAADGYTIQEKPISIPDPVVLFPLRDNYYVIVSKWGLEANDQSLVIPENN
jgi:hypothetical protein